MLQIEAGNHIAANQYRHLLLSPTHAFLYNTAPDLGPLIKAVHYPINPSPTDSIKKPHIMPLTSSQKKQYRTLGHNLKPVVMIADKGVTEGVDKELERALNDHELIKVKLNVNDPAIRKLLAQELCDKHRALLVQAIGKMVLIYRANPKPNPKLSNLLRAT